MSRRKTTQAAEPAPEQVIAPTLEQQPEHNPVAEPALDQQPEHNPVAEPALDQQPEHNPVAEPALDQQPEPEQDIAADISQPMGQEAPTPVELSKVVMLQPMAGIDIDWPVGSEQTLPTADAQRLIDAGMAQAKE